MALDLTTLTKYLGEAEIALHKLSLGETIVTTSNIDGGSATYNQASRRGLETYIASLEQKIAVKNSTARRAPIHFLY